MGRNPATGQSIKIPAKTVVRMRVAKAAISPGKSGAVADGTIYRTYGREGRGGKACELKTRCVKVPRPSITWTMASTLTTRALYPCSLRWFEASPCKLISRGLPSSLVQLRGALTD